MKKYVLGIGFCQQGVAMVRKNRPEWQAGKLNFIGGKFEPEDNDNGFTAISREFNEETGVLISPDNWKYMGFMKREDEFIVEIYVAADESISNVKTMEDEQIAIVDYDSFMIDSELQSLYITNIPTLYQFAVSEDFLVQGAILQINYP